jgi:hypothetical protein
VKFSRLGITCLLLVASCTIGGSHAVLPSPVGAGDGSPDDDSDPPDDGDADGEGDSEGEGDGDGDGDGDTPRQDAGLDGAMPDAGDGDDDGSLEPPAGCTAGTHAGHTYFFCEGPLFWDEARAACQSEGLDLVVIEDQPENDFINDSIDADRWIGLNDIDTEGTYVWIVPGEGGLSGAALNFAAWSQPFQPDDCVGLGDQDCVHIAGDGAWDDHACNTGAPVGGQPDPQNCPIVSGPRGYICETF